MLFVFRLRPFTPFHSVSPSMLPPNVLAFAPHSRAAPALRFLTLFLGIATWFGLGGAYFTSLFLLVRG